MTNTNDKGNTMTATPICLLTTTHYLRMALRTNAEMLAAHRDNPALHATVLRAHAGMRNTLPIVKAANA